MTASGRWSQGILIGLPVAAVLAVVFLAVAVAALVWFLRNRDDYSSGDALIVSGGAFMALILTAVITGWSLWPFQAQYHRWEDKTGTVTDVSSRFLTEDKSVNQKFVVRFTDGQEYGCNDTRCSLVKTGDLLTLSCKRSWQFTGRAGWDCNYIERRPGR